MPEFNPQKLASLRNALADFQKRPLREASEALLSVIGYKSDKTADFGSKPEQFVAAVEEASCYSGLLDRAVTVTAIAAQFERKNAGNLFSGRGGKLTDAGKQVKSCG